MKNNIAFAMVTFLATLPLSAQEITASDTLPVRAAERIHHLECDDVFTVVEEMPCFPGGDEAMFRFIGEELKYPKEAMDEEIQGVIYISFIVEKDGSITTIEVLRGSGSLCTEVVRMLHSMPKWSPGKQRGKPVRVQYKLPIRFQMR